MRPGRKRALVLGCSATVALLAALLLAGGERGLALYGYVLFLGALGLLLLTGGIGLALPEARSLDRLLRRRPEADERVPQLETLGRRLGAGRASASELHYRLRPLVRELAAARLARSHGVDLDRQPGIAERLVGVRVWELIRPDRQPPEERYAGGLSKDELAELVDELERI